MNEVKRYAIISDDWDYVESPSGGFVDHDDYDALEAECGRLREAAGRWIPVSERLPSVAQEVIVDSEFDGITAGFLDSYGEWYSPNSDYKLTRVVAWQPLPDAPSLAANRKQAPSY